MPRKKTYTAPTYSPVIRHATALHVRERRRCFRFDELVDSDNQPKRVITIGRRPRSDIRVDDGLVSYDHALLKRHADGRTTIMAAEGCKNGVFVNGRLLTEPVLLTVGMQIRIGSSRLVGATCTGSFPVSGYDNDDYMRHAGEMYGSNNLAAKHIRRSASRIREARLPPGERRRRKGKGKKTR